MSTSSTVRFTYADHRSIPEDHRRHEIVDGELFVTPTPRVNHQRVAFDLTVALDTRARKHDLGAVVGPITVHLHDELVLEPDIVFVREDRMAIVDPEGDIHGPPDLVAESLSPSTHAFDRNVKGKRYLEHGVEEVWIVDIDARAVEVWRVGEEAPRVVTGSLRWRVGGPEPAELEIPLEEVFRRVG